MPAVGVGVLLVVALTLELQQGAVPAWRGSTSPVELIVSTAHDRFTVGLVLGLEYGHAADQVRAAEAARLVQHRAAHPRA